MRDGFVMRYKTDETDDGLPPGEGTFLPCTFWMVDNLALIGEIAEATEIFERLLSLRNDVGLLSEEWDVAEKRQVGNFPQALTHVGLVNSAYNLDRARRARQQRCARPRRTRASLAGPHTLIQLPVAPARDFSGSSTTRTVALTCIDETLARWLDSRASAMAG